MSGLNVCERNPLSESSRSILSGSQVRILASFIPLIGNFDRRLEMFDTEFDYDYAPSQRGIQLPYEDAWVDTGTFKLFISAELDGVQNFVSECGWWMS